MALIAEDVAAQLKDEFANLVNPVRLAVFSQALADPESEQVKRLVEELGGLDPRLTAQSYNFVLDIEKVEQLRIARIPAIAILGAEKDYGKLVALALPVLKTGGVLFASTNAGDWPAEKFLASVAGPIRLARRKILRQHYAPQPPDFPISRAEPAYLKTVWLRIV